MKKILLIEDEQALGEMYESKLTESGFEVAWLVSAEEGLERVREINPDLVVLDILLPEQNGLFFLENLRKMSEKKVSQTPVVVLSNYDEPETRKKSRQLKIEGYLLKTDYTPNDLVEEITRIYSQKSNLDKN